MMLSKNDRMIERFRCYWKQYESEIEDEWYYSEEDFIKDNFVVYGRLV